MNIPLVFCVIIHMLCMLLVEVDFIQVVSKQKFSYNLVQHLVQNCVLGLWASCNKTFTQQFLLSEKCQSGHLDSSNFVYIPLLMKLTHGLSCGVAAERKSAEDKHTHARVS